MKFQMNIVNIWPNEFDNWTLKPLTDDITLIAEKKLDVKLPRIYLEILKKRNGGYLNKRPLTLSNIFPDHENPEKNDELLIDYLFGISEKKSEGILLSKQLIQEWDLPNDLVLIAGEGHWWIALDYRHHVDGDPPLVYLDEDNNLEVQIAKNFEEFLQKLKPYAKEG